MTTETPSAQRAESAKGPALHTRLPGQRPAPPEELLDRFVAWVAERGLTPYPAQEEALLELWAERHVVLQTPTGSGKSLVALALHFKAIGEGVRSFYTAPTKALANEKFFALCDELGAERVGMLTGDASINGAAPVICCTAEVLANMSLRRGDALDVPYVVMDEFHFYGDAERGASWQIPLLTLSRTQFLLMSATLGNTAALETQLRRATDRAVRHVYSSERPVPLDFEYRETPIHETVEALLDDGQAPIYIVHFTQREAVEQAQALAAARVGSRERRREIAAAVEGFRFDSPYGRELRRLLRHGVGLHHAGLLPKYRLLVERLAQRGLLRVVCGTDTLGVGVNIPIRTVLFSSLSKFDGEQVKILAVRDFQQIAGRAGRRGFDDRGRVVCQAPAARVARRRAAERRRRAGPPRRGPRRPPRSGPARTAVAWNRSTFRRLREHRPETLVSRFRVTYGAVVSLLQRSEETGRPDWSYRSVIHLIERAHERPAQKRRHRREAARIFRSLREAGVIELVPPRVAAPRCGPQIRVARDLQRDLSMHHSLSLYLVETVALLDRDHPAYARDLLSTVEAILENPRAILQRQREAAQRELAAELRARRVPYEERVARLRRVTHPQPRADFFAESFHRFTTRYPWLGGEAIRPKAVAREMWQRYEDFSDYIRRYRLQRSEGLLLRYLGQLLSVLLRSLPERARNDEVEELIGFFRAMLSRVDSSLLQEWERLTQVAGRGAEPAAAPLPLSPGSTDLAVARRALSARVRAEMHQLVRALAARAYEEAAAALRWEEDDPWDGERLAAAMEPYYAEYQKLLWNPAARRAHHTAIVERAPRRFTVHQVLLDDRGDNIWVAEAEIDLREERDPSEPLLRLRRIGP